MKNTTMRKWKKKSRNNKGIMVNREMKKNSSPWEYSQFFLEEEEIVKESIKQYQSLSKENTRKCELIILRVDFSTENLWVKLGFWLPKFTHKNNIKIIQYIYNSFYKEIQSIYE